MPKVSLDIPRELLDDMQRHVGDERKFVSTADLIRTCLRKGLDHLDEIDVRRGRIYEPNEQEEVNPRDERIQRIRERHPRAYMRWSEEEDEALMRAHREGLTIRELTELFERQRGGIRSRINKLLDEDEQGV